MATVDLSAYDASQIPSATDLRFGIVVAEWNENITKPLAQGAIDTLRKHGVTDENIIVKHVPGTFELTYGCKLMIQNTMIDAVIAIGCVIQGETPHFTYICQGVTAGITSLNVEYDIPIIFGVLTVDNMQQALDRAGGKHGNKGVEAAVTAIKMAALDAQMRELDEWQFFSDDDDIDDDDDTDEQQDNLFNYNQN